MKVFGFFFFLWEKQPQDYLHLFCLRKLLVRGKPKSEIDWPHFLIFLLSLQLTSWEGGGKKKSNELKSIVGGGKRRNYVRTGKTQQAKWLCKATSTRAYLN